LYFFLDSGHLLDLWLDILTIIIKHCEQYAEFDYVEEQADDLIWIYMRKTELVREVHDFAENHHALHCYGGDVGQLQDDHDETLHGFRKLVELNCLSCGYELMNVHQSYRERYNEKAHVGYR